jgi:hypothetical protein
MFELPVVFHSQGVPLAGRVFRNTESLQERHRATNGLLFWRI